MTGAVATLPRVELHGGGILMHLRFYDCAGRVVDFSIQEWLRIVSQLKTLETEGAPPNGD